MGCPGESEAMTRDDDNDEDTELKPQGHSGDPGSSGASDQSLPVRWQIVWGRGTNAEAERKFPLLTEAKACVFKDTGNKGA